MAKYKEQWKSPIDPEVTGHVDTETGRFIQINSNNPFQEDFNEWVAAGGIPDPAYTAEEIAAYQTEKDRQDAILDQRNVTNIPAMTLQERFEFVEAELEEATTVEEVADATINVLKALIAYI